jgi:hypothetical protein
MGLRSHIATDLANIVQTDDVWRDAVYTVQSTGEKISDAKVYPEYGPGDTEGDWGGGLSDSITLQISCTDLDRPAKGDLVEFDSEVWRVQTIISGGKFGDRSLWSVEAVQNLRPTR